VSEHRAMPDSTLPIFQQPPIRVVFRPYDHDAVQALLKQVSMEFGRPGPRYRYISPADTFPELNEIMAHEANAWTLDFHFANPHDAIIFGLKYQR
jgi:hypothetical protein